MNDNVDVDDAMLDWEAVMGEIDFELSVELTEGDANTIHQLARDSYKEGMDAGIKYALVILRQAVKQIGTGNLIMLDTNIERLRTH